MSYYDHFRADRPSRGGFHYQEIPLAILTHASLLLGLAHPLGSVVGPMICLLTLGERHRNLEGEAMEALNFGIIVSLISMPAAALLRSIGLTENGLAIAYVAGAFLLAAYVLAALRTVKDGRPHRYWPSTKAMAFPPAGSRGATLGTDYRRYREGRGRKG